MTALRGRYRPPLLSDQSKCSSSPDFHSAASDCALWPTAYWSSNAVIVSRSDASAWLKCWLDHICTNVWCRGALWVSELWPRRGTAVFMFLSLGCLIEFPPHHCYNFSAKPDEVQGKAFSRQILSIRWLRARHPAQAFTQPQLREVSLTQPVLWTPPQEIGESSRVSSGSDWCCRRIPRCGWT